MVGAGEDRVGSPPVDAPCSRGEQGGDGGGDVVVEQRGDLGQRCDVGVVEGVDPPEDVLPGAMAHEPAPHRVLDPCRPGEVGGEALAQQVGRDPEPEIVGAQVLVVGRVAERLVVAELPAPLAVVDAGHEPGSRIDGAGVGVGVERLDGHPEQFHDLGRGDEHP